MESWASAVTSIGFLIFFIGIVLILIGILLNIVKRGSRAKRSDESEKQDENKGVRGGGVIVIGPIPIVFGTDRKALLLAVAVALVFMVLYLVFLLAS
jgi:uncharacterized protein (TIGR00304 family)